MRLDQIRRGACIVAQYADDETAAVYHACWIAGLTVDELLSCRNAVGQCGRRHAAIMMLARIGWPRGRLSRVIARSPDTLRNVEREYGELEYGEMAA